MRALIVDDDTNSLRAMAALVQREGFTVSTAENLRQARERIKDESPEIVLADLVLPDGSGLDLLADRAEAAPAIEVVLITGHASVETAVQALRSGVADYLTKPVDIGRLKTVLANLTRTQELKGEISELRGELRKLGRFGPLVGTSPPMQQVYDLITRVARTEATVLITGESGTGKELVAATVHHLSRRGSRPFLAINCGAISPTLIESELFGHERGSFTGADRAHKGFFERADGGTLFLDEVSEMPPELQVKLLRVLETAAVQRVGGDKPIRIDVRVLAATNRDLDEAVAAGKVRQDLLYRLKVFPIALPPLRDRPDDVEALAEHFLAEFNQAERSVTSGKGGRPVRKRLASTALAALRAYAWPGNVRELKNILHRAYILAESEIRVSDLPPEIAGVGASGAEVPPPDDAPGVLRVVAGTPLAEVERRLLLASLEKFGGDKQKTAEALGVSLKTVYNRLKEYQAGD